MTPLDHLIRREIGMHGPMTLGQYMGLCLGHPDHGYYMTRDPFGVQGDFITAPEVSQMFGEIIGAWLVDIWRQMGEPSPCLLIEAGPGRGTLMSDILRATKSVPAFHAAVQIHLLEMSPVLTQMQRAALEDYTVHWHAGLETLPENAPVLFVANEFLDALPFEQLQFDRGEWMQRAVGIGADNALQAGLKEMEPSLRRYIAGLSRQPQEGDILEVSPAMDGLLHQLGNRLKKQSGAGLFIDYGYENTAFGQSMQALHQHQPVSIFFKPGESDITAHVNFGHVAAQLSAMDLHATRIVTQSHFLKTIGIENRLARLEAVADAEQARELREGYHRLTAEEEMGTLFKVLGFASDSAIMPAGF